VVVLYTCIQEVNDLDLNHDMNDPDVFLWFSSVSPGNFPGYYFDEAKATSSKFIS
jgi:hypothetical protein